MTAHVTTAGNVILFCNECVATFTRDSPIAHRTRIRAESAGWKTATYADRTDYCPNCWKDAA